MGSCLAQGVKRVREVWENLREVREESFAFAELICLGKHWLLMDCCDFQGLCGWGFARPLEESSLGAGGNGETGCK